jgi:hypothetical protein
MSTIKFLNKELMTLDCPGYTDVALFDRHNDLFSNWFVIFQSLNKFEILTRSMLSEPANFAFKYFREGTRTDYQSLI